MIQYSANINASANLPYCYLVFCLSWYWTLWYYMQLYNLVVSNKILWYHTISYHIMSCHINLCGVVWCGVVWCVMLWRHADLLHWLNHFSSLSLFILLLYYISIYLILNCICSTFKFSRIILINIFLSFRVNILLFYLIIKSYIGRCGNCVWHFP